MADWVEQRLDELRERLTLAEEEVTTYRIENELISGDPQSTLGEQQLIELNTILIETRAALAEKRATYIRSQQLLEDDGDLQTLPEVQTADLITEIRTRLLELELRESELRRLNPEDSRLRIISEERKEVEARLALEVGRMVAMIRHQLETLEAREALLTDALKDTERRTGEESRNTDQLRALERVVEGYRTLHERYLSTAGIVDEEVSLLLNSIEIIEHPVVPSQAFYPPSKVLIIWGLLFGGALGVVISILREAANRGLFTSEQVEFLLNMSVLAMLPAPSGPQRSDKCLTLRQSVAEHPGRPLSEAIRSLRLDLTTSNPTQADMLLVIPAGLRDGAGDLAMALAVSAQQAGKSVILVDATPSCSASAPVLGTDPQFGRNAGDADTPPLIRQGDVMPGIDVMLAGQHLAGKNLPDNPVMLQTLAEARRDYHLVLVMAAPAHTSPDTRPLAELADHTLLVLREAVTPQDTAQAAATRLRTAKAPAVVMVQCNPERVRNHGEIRFLHDII